MLNRYHTERKMELLFVFLYKKLMDVIACMRNSTPFLHKDTSSYMVNSIKSFFQHSYSHLFRVQENQAISDAVTVLQSFLKFAEGRRVKSLVWNILNSQRYSEQKEKADIKEVQILTDLNMSLWSIPLLLVKKLKAFGVLLLKLHLEGKSILKMKSIYSEWNVFIPTHLLDHLLFSYEPRNSQIRKK